MPAAAPSRAPHSAAFDGAAHTVVLSDVHLCEAEPVDPKRPLWKKFKQRELFIDPCFARFLDYIQTVTEGPIELVFNGDLFDFDSVTALPEEPKFPVSWLERRRGLHPEERKSLWKIRLVLRDHHVWFDALRAFLLAGNRLVFVIGNHAWSCTGRPCSGRSSRRWTCPSRVRACASASGSTSPTATR